MRTKPVTIQKRNAAEIERAVILKGVARGERAIEDRRIVTPAEAKKRMARWLS